MYRVDSRLIKYVLKLRYFVIVIHVRTEINLEWQYSHIISILNTIL